ncbi:hypothetical protein FHS79_002994 [Polymorphobacter multimanifer]|uniref:L,D-TPase catalytic domain-containing protein n=1 Tax=Polymorphobacter multimanifer TaxID=1070431 RepID=A0A841LCU3_9SPHN|nr:hypothetical protein [Polymorphobacter multimanifer]
MRLAIAVLCAILIGGGWAAQKQAEVVMPVPVPVVPIEGDRIDYQNGRNPALVLPDGQVRVVRSIINTRRQLAFGDYVWNDEGVAEGPVWARVDLKRQTLSVFRAGHEIGTTVILFGANSNPTPSGVFPVLAKAQKHRSSLYDAEMPFMMRLTNDGVAIHASAVQEGSATHGCIGVPLEFARLLFGQMQVGDEVAIFAA